LPLPAPSKVIWYVGQTVAHSQVVAVIFEADSPAGPKLVVGRAVASKVMNGQPGFSWRTGRSPWVIYSVPAPPPSQSGLAVGLNVHGALAAPGQNPDDWIVELTAPAIQTFLMQVRHPTGESIAAHITVGLLIRDVGQITAPVRVSLQPGQLSGRVRFYGAEPVGLPGSLASEVPQLALPAPLTVAGSVLLSVSGQGDITREFVGPPADRIIARCYGPAPLTVKVSTEPWTFDTIPCDNGQHELSLHGRQRHVTWLYVNTSGLTSYRVALVSH
jgi:hypothetical protein